MQTGTTSISDVSCTHTHDPMQRSSSYPLTPLTRPGRNDSLSKSVNVTLSKVPPISISCCVCASVWIQCDGSGVQHLPKRATTQGEVAIIKSLAHSTLPHLLAWNLTVHPLVDENSGR